MSSVTHELRTPLTSIRALAELMRDDPAMAPAQRQPVSSAIIVGETERLSRLVNQVLDMAKIESGHAEWHTAEVDLRALLTQAVQTTAEMFRERGASVALEMPASVPLLQADPDRLLQVLLNLLSNAAKFVPAGRGQVRIRLRADAERATVEVEDNGPGVPAEQQALVFEKFRQGGDASNRPQGTGLGLPISRQIVEHFGGRMWLSPSPVGVPASASTCRGIAPEADRKGGDKPSMNRKDEQKVADDEPNIVISLEYLMKREGHAVSIARDGEEALEAIRREPDLVLLDVMMPKKSGFEVCQEVRANDAARDQDPDADRQGPRHRSRQGHRRWAPTPTSPSRSRPASWPRACASCWGWREPGPARARRDARARRAARGSRGRDRRALRGDARRRRTCRARRDAGAARRVAVAALAGARRGAGGPRAHRLPALGGGAGAARRACRRAARGRRPGRSGQPALENCRSAPGRARSGAPSTPSPTSAMRCAPTCACACRRPAARSSRSAAGWRR